MTSIVGALAEAWDEVRVHKSRFILSLVGVFLAVFTLTTVHALGQIGLQLIEQETERYAGRPGTLSASIYSDKEGAITADVQEAALRDWAKTIESSHHGMVTSLEDYSVDAEDIYGMYMEIQAVDEAYSKMHLVQMGSGRWLQASDAQQLAPRMVVNPHLAEMAKLPKKLTSPVTLNLTNGTDTLTAVVVGITRDPMPEARAYLDYRQARSLGLIKPKATVSMELWVGADSAGILRERFSDVSGIVPGGTLNVSRTDWGDDVDFFSFLPWVIRVLGLFALGLASLGVIGVGIVTVRGRIREIGVRRSFGATGRRVFAAILLESTVASLAAGVLGVLASIALLRTPWPMLLQEWIIIETIPPFPLHVAFEGLLYASLVGAAAGFIPAIMAVRAKVIEAIRF